MITTLPDRIDALFSRLRLSRDTGVIAVSGGPDSVALLRILALLQARGRLHRLVVVHLNHQLRGQESDLDETFVRDLVARLSRDATRLSFESRCLDVRALAEQHGENLESCGRRLRYDFFTQIARDIGAQWVATGHTADDQAETVLHRLLRGSGLLGLCGIPVRRELGGGIEVVRPLLSVRRREVLAYLEAESQAFRVDSSNVDLTFTRNRIRHELLPSLVRDYNPAIVEVLCRLAEQAAETQGRVLAEAADLLSDTELPRAGNMLVFDQQRLKAASRHIVREVFRLVWQRENWPMGQMDHDAWDRVAGVALGEVRSVDLPSNVHAHSTGRVLQIEREQL
jgi:tRNA(Ile)-lysidine synthase